MRKIKIVHVQVLPIMSGVQKAMTELLIRLDQKKYDITVICQSEGELTTYLKQINIPFITLPELKREISLFYDVSALVKLFFLFRKHKFDIVHTHSSKPGFLGRLAAKLAGVPKIVHTVQGFAFHQFSSHWGVLFFQFLERMAGLVTDKLIIVNETDYNYAKEKKLVKSSRLVKVYNGISTAEYDIALDVAFKKRSLNIPENYQVVGSVGRLWKQKAPHIFVEAMPKVLDQCPETMFLLTGDGPLRNELESLLNRLSIQNNVKLLGWRKDIPEILTILDIFVQTSLWEGLSLSIMEAMAAAKPVVASDIKGNNELVLCGKTGYLVDPGNPNELSDRILQLLKNRNLARKMGLEGRERVKKEFDIIANVAKIEHIYRTDLFTR